MSKKDFIALADAIKEHNRIMLNIGTPAYAFDLSHLETLANFCQDSNSNFMRDRWLGYIAGTNGKNGGSVKNGKV